MTELPEIPSVPSDRFKPIATVIWIALITAIVVTIIDWKIKQDILRLTDAFYRVYPTAMEQEHGRSTEMDRVRDPGPLLRFPPMDIHAGMEAEMVPSPNGNHTESVSTDGAEPEPGTTDDSSELPSGTE